MAAIALVVVAVGLFAHVRTHADDARMIQGEWNVEGNGMTMVIDATTMHLPQNVDYAYELDTFRGDIEFANGTLVGEGSYRFSDGGDTLVITEKIPTLTTNAKGEEVESTTTATLMLTRISHDTSAKPALLSGAATSDPAPESVFDADEPDGGDSDGDDFEDDEPED